MSPQQFIAHYRIAGKLGEGGMGTVWRATDTKLNRDVAIKILPEALACDADRMARFAREAQVLASMNHPNIAAIYGVEERALVMELVEGPTLAERIGTAAVTFAEAVPIAREIAEALEYAHERGVIHRDLKPANIKLTPEGKVKVLDFGLAAVTQASAAGTAGANPMTSPTLTMQATMAGTILGTAAYMSPEQAKGKPVDRRSDIWSFGVVLYEMLTGRQLYTGETVSETLASVIKDAPDLTLIPSGTPPAILRLLRRCLEKDPRRRLQAIGEARLALEEPLQEAAAEPASVQPAAPSTRRATLAWAVAAVLALLLAAAATQLWVHLREKPPARTLVRFTISPPAKQHFGMWLVLSPDGRHLAFLASGKTGTELWLRSLATLDARPLATIEGTTGSFFWSADSHFLAFTSGGKLKKVDLAGGPPQILCDVTGTLLGGTWNRDGVILIGTNTSPILRVPDAGGTPVAITRKESDRGEAGHLFPVFLPDGRHFLYFRRSATAYSGIYAGSLDTKPEDQRLERIQETTLSFEYTPPLPGDSGPGHLLFVREGSLLAQPFDERLLTTVGQPVPIAAEVGSYLTRAFFSVSRNGVLAYRSGGEGVMQLNWYDRTGKILGPAGKPADYQDVALSPDATRVAYSLPAQSDRQISILDAARGVNTRVSFTADGARSPAWSPDGRQIAFGSFHNAETGLYIQDAGNSGTERAVFRSVSTKYLNDWSRDGRFLVYTEFAAGTGADIVALPIRPGGGEARPIPVANSKANEAQAQVSPDSRWIAYCSDESGRFEIYVRPFPPDDRRSGKWLVSAAAGVQPRWRADGKELFYLSADAKLMAVDIRTDPAFQPGAPHILFDAGITGSSPYFRYDVARDGTRFLIPAAAAESASVPATVVLNWQEALKK
jgi:Tol biopolymer transport system component